MTDITDNIIEQRKRILSPSLSLSYNEPLHIIRGRRQYLYDADGNEFLDATNNIQHVGHSHPKVVEATLRQLKRLNTNTRYLDKTILDYASLLIQKMPNELNKVFFTNSGSESNDLALRLARNYLQNNETIVLDGAYHGHLISLIEVSPYKYKGPGGITPPENVHELPIPDPYRGKHRGENSGRKYAEEMNTILKKVKVPPTFLSESIMGCGGQLIPPKGFMKKAYDLVKASDGLCIADEVQIGFGRMGDVFWGFESQNVVPDIVSLGKSIGNGHPLSVVITTKEIADRFNNGMEYFNSYGGNPVSCAIGKAVLEIIEEEELQKNAREVGIRLLKMLQELEKKHEHIGDVRGKGLFLGIEIMEGSDYSQPSKEIATLIVNKMKESGILVSTDGPDHNVIKIKPPMVFNFQNACQLTETLDSILLKI